MVGKEDKVGYRWATVAEGVWPALAGGIRRRGWSRGQLIDDAFVLKDSECCRSLLPKIYPV